MGFLRGIGPLEIIIILGLILLIFGWRRMPEIGSSMGKGIRTFKSALLGDDDKNKQDPPMAKGGAERNPYERHYRHSKLRKELAAGWFLFFL